MPPTPSVRTTSSRWATTVPGGCTESVMTEALRPAHRPVASRAARQVSGDGGCLVPVSRRALQVVTQRIRLARTERRVALDGEVTRQVREHAAGGPDELRDRGETRVAVDLQVVARGRAHVRELREPVEVRERAVALDVQVPADRG